MNEPDNEKPAIDPAVIEQLQEVVTQVISELKKKNRI